MSRRVVLLPTMDQPHANGMWLQLYERWQNEVDKLYVHVNDYTHGVALKYMLDKWVYRDDIVMLIENDGIVFKPGIVDKYFKIIEDGKADIVGSPRMSCHPEIAEAAKKKWNLDYEGFGDKGPNLWPNMFFIKAKHLFDTDMHFHAKGWKKGDKIKELDHVVENDNIMGDTLVWTCIQLRAEGLKIHEIPQYHASPYDIENAEKKEGIFDGKCPYFHFGSLTGDFTVPQDDISSRELERRAAWLDLCGQNMSSVVKGYQLNEDRFEQLKIIYKDLLYARIH